MFYDRYCQLCRSRGVSPSRAALEMGISKGTVSVWKQRPDSMPSGDTLARIAQYFGVSTDWLLGLREHAAQDEPVRRIPIYGTVAAGLPMFAQQNIEGYTVTDLPGDNYFALRVRGDSMNAARIEDGDVLIVRRQPTVEDGSIAVVLIDDGATVKRLYRSGNSITLMPQSTNPEHKPQIYDMRRNTVTVLGRVLQVVTQTR